MYIFTLTDKHQWWVAFCMFACLAAVKHCRRLDSKENQHKSVTQALFLTSAPHVMITNLSSQQLAQMFSTGNKNYQKIPIFKYMTSPANFRVLIPHIIGDRFIQATLSLSICCKLKSGARFDLVLIFFTILKAGYQDFFSSPKFQMFPGLAKHAECFTGTTHNYFKHLPSQADQRLLWIVPASLLLQISNFTNTYLPFYKLSNN